MEEKQTMAVSITVVTSKKTSLELKLVGIDNYVMDVPTGMSKKKADIEAEFRRRIECYMMTPEGFSELGHLGGFGWGDWAECCDIKADVPTETIHKFGIRLDNGEEPAPVVAHVTISADDDETFDQESVPGVFHCRNGEEYGVPDLPCVIGLSLERGIDFLTEDVERFLEIIDNNGLAEGSTVDVVNPYTGETYTFDVDENYEIVRPFEKEEEE